MSPIERMQARQAAYELLGLEPSADSGTIRAAWRRAAFAAHPDRNGGDYAPFMRAKEAYELIASAPAGRPTNAGSGTSSSGSGRAGARPRVSTRLVELTEDAIAQCQALLSDETGGAALGGEGQALEIAASHVPHAVRQHGRSLTFMVSDPLSPGLNRIALPTALLEDARRVKPQTIVVRAARGGAGEVTIPDAKRTRMFPGARNISLRFGTS